MYKMETFHSLIRQGILEVGDGYRAKLDELGGNGPIFLRAGSLTNQGFVWQGNDRFRSDLASRVQSKIAQHGDVVITTKGNSTGRTGYVDTDAPSFVYSPHLSYWRSLRPDLLYPGFLRYWAKCGEFVDQLRAMAHSTDMAPYLSLADQSRLRITLPTISDQVGVATVLGALDDKIAVNARATEVAMQLVKSYFAHVASVAGTRCVLGEIVEFRYGKSLPARDRVDGPYPVYGSGGISGSHNEALTSGPGIIIGRKGTVGTVYWEDRDFFAIDTTFYVKPKNSNVPLEFLYWALRDLGLENLNSDSAVPGLNRSHALALEVPIPDERILADLAAQIRPMFELRRVRNIESESLAVLREALLPKLISGEMRVRDAEKVVEEAV